MLKAPAFMLALLLTGAPLGAQAADNNNDSSTNEKSTQVDYRQTQKTSATWLKSANQQNPLLGVLIQDTKTAEALVSDNQEQWGLQNNHSSLQFTKVVENSYGSTYVFQQFLGDLEVFDHGVHIQTDAQGFITALIVDIQPLPEEWEVGPNLTAAEVILKLEQNQGSYAIQVTDARLGLTQQGGELDLAYRLRLVMDGGQSVGLTADAGSGQVLEVTQEGALTQLVHPWI